MEEKELLQNVKLMLGITVEDEQLDSNLLLKVKAVKTYLIHGGASYLKDQVTDTALSCMAIGVNDLLNSKAGETKFSPAFNMLAMQVCSRKEG